jgi:hypothetical protein
MTDVEKILQKNWKKHNPKNKNEEHILNTLHYFNDTQRLNIHGKMKMEDAYILQQKYKEYINNKL